MGSKAVRYGVRFLCILGLVVGFSALAQDPSVPDLTGLSVEELSRVRLSTASRHLDDPRKAPAAITVITSEEIQRYGWRTVADVLRSITGFYTAYDRSYTYVGVRGFLQSGDYNARILLLIDGHRVNDNIYDSGLIGTEFPLDLSLIDRIEVVRGPGSSLFGTNAELAVVNVFTRHPAPQTSVEITGEADSFTGRIGEIRASLQNGRYASLLSGSVYRSNGAGKLYFPEFDSPDTNNGIANNLDGDRYTHLFGVVRSGQFRLEGVFGSRDKIVPNAPYGTIFGDPANRTMDTRGYVDASYTHEFSANTQLDLRAYYDAYRFKGSYPYADVNGSARSVQINDAAADGVGIEAVVGQRLGKHRIVAGTAGEYNFRINQRNYYVGQPPFLDDHRTLSLAAVFGEAEINPSARFSFNLGGRLDWYDLYGTTLSPRVAAMYFPTAATSVKYIFGHAFRAPDPYDEFYVDQVDVTATNKSLKPENINSHTLLFDHAFNRTLHLDISGFSNRLNQIIEEEQDQATGDTHFANEKGNSGQGVEFELAAGRPSGWMARTSYTIERTSQSLINARVMNSPEHLAKFNGIAPIRRIGFLGGEAFFTGPQPNYLGQRIPSSLLVNATISSRTFWNSFQLSASCYNLTDRTWRTPTGPEVVQPATVQDGRTWRFRLTYHSREKKWVTK